MLLPTLLSPSFSILWQLRTNCNSKEIVFCSIMSKENQSLEKRRQSSFFLPVVLHKPVYSFRITLLDIRHEFELLLECNHF